MHEAPIRVQGEITRVLQPILCEVRLPNGKLTLGHLSKALKQAAAPLEVGGWVELEMTPFDFDSGRVSKLLDRAT